MGKPERLFEKERNLSADERGRRYRSLAGNLARRVERLGHGERHKSGRATLMGKVTVLLDEAQPVMVKLRDEEKVQLHHGGQPDGHDVGAMVPAES